MRMRSTVVVVCTIAIVFAALVALVSSSTSTMEIKPALSKTEIRELWISFMRKHEKLYGSIEEHSRRFDIFSANLDKVRKMNEMEQDNVYGITRFMDLTEREFASMYLWREPRSAEKLRSRSVGLAAVAALPAQQRRTALSVPESFDWREHGAVTPVKNQGSCGSCWSFSATGNIEGIVYNKKGRLVPLSEQQMVDCDHTCNDSGECNSGCNGGWMMSALQYARDNGMQPSSTYPYTAHEGTCKYNDTAAVIKIDGAVMLPEDEEHIKAYLAEHGPLAVALNAANLQFYFGGISDPLMCNPKNLSHGVLLVGYGRGKTVFGKEKDFWIVKNSWGSSWGEEGYFRMARGKGTCGINTYVVSAIVN